MIPEEAAIAKWGNHPMGWPVPPQQMPRWWQFRARRVVDELRQVFGPIDQPALDAFWGEVRKGQSVYEDAGGYMIRCYAAMTGHAVDEPYTYAQAVDDLISRRLP